MPYPKMRLYSSKLFGNADGYRRAKPKPGGRQRRSRGEWGRWRPPGGTSPAFLWLPTACGVRGGLRGGQEPHRDFSGFSGNAWCNTKLGGFLETRTVAVERRQGTRALPPAGYTHQRKRNLIQLKKNKTFGTACASSGSYNGFCWKAVLEATAVLWFGIWRSGGWGLFVGLF